jgi:hypothetical protein
MPYNFTIQRTIRYYYTAYVRYTPISHGIVLSFLPYNFAIHGTTIQRMYVIQLSAMVLFYGLYPTISPYMVLQYTVRTLYGYQPWYCSMVYTH